MKKCEYCLGATWIEPYAHNRIISRYTGRSSREQGASILLNADTETGTYTIFKELCNTWDFRTHLEDWFFKKLEIMLKNQTELDGRVLL